jgi:hypothetical protein
MRRGEIMMNKYINWLFLKKIKFRSVLILFIIIVIFSYIDRLWLKNILYADIHDPKEIYVFNYTNDFHCISLDIPIKYISEIENEKRLMVCPSWRGVLDLNYWPHKKSIDLEKGIISSSVVSRPFRFVKINILYIRYYITLDIRDWEWKMNNISEDEKNKIINEIKILLDIIERDISHIYRIKRIMHLNVDRSKLKDKLKKFEIKENQ